MSSNGDNNTDEQQHYLDSFLQERLPALGLDYETYGSYVRGLVDEDDDDNAHIEESDNTTWDEILDLLQASSETHSDDNEVWIELKQEIQSRRMQHVLEREQQEQRQKQERWAEEHERLAQDIALAKQKAHEEELEQQGMMAKKPKELDDTKRMLVARYAYDESEMYDKDGNLIAGTGETDEANMVSNKDAAAMASQEKLRQMKSQKTVSKKEEQQKTKQAKLDKIKLKEERRNRAQKGERHR